MAQNVMRRAGKAAVATGVAAAVSLNSDTSTIHAEEINDVARVVFCSSQSLSPSLSQSSSQRGGFRVSSDPAIHEALVKLGTRIASNPKIQQLVQEEVGDWLLVNTVPGGPPIHAIKEESYDQSSNQACDSSDQSTPSVVRSAFAAELDHLNDDDFRILREAPVVKPFSQSINAVYNQDEDVMDEILTPRGQPDDCPVNRSSFIEQVFDWIQDKLASVVGLFTHHSNNQSQTLNQPLNQSQAQMNPEAHQLDNNESESANHSSNQPMQPSARFTAAALGIAAVLIVLVTCRRFSPALFKAAIKFIQ